MKHKHHILPRHMGGGNEPTNLIEVSVEQHAELHLALYLEHGYTADWVASQCLSGQMTIDDAKVEAMRIGAINSQKNRTHEDRSAAAKKGNTAEVRARKSATMTGRKRRPRTEEEKQRIRETLAKTIAAKRAAGLNVGRPKGSLNKRKG